MINKMSTKYSSRLAAGVVVVALALLATVGLQWCMVMASHASEHCHGCGTTMDVGEHLAWWQGQLQSTPASSLDLGLLALLVLVVMAAVPALVVAPLLVDARFQLQRFRPPGANYLTELFSAGILNPKVFSAAR